MIQLFAPIPDYFKDIIYKINVNINNIEDKIKQKYFMITFIKKNKYLFYNKQKQILVVKDKPLFTFKKLMQI